MTPEFTLALGGIVHIPQFFIWRLTWNPHKAKFEKHPIYHPSNPVPMDSADPANWMTYSAACEALARYRQDEPHGRFTLGWRMTQDCGYWFLDLDAVITDGQWHPTALEWYGKLPGVFLEYSASGNGAHLIGKGALPAHRKKRIKGFEIDCELYTESRGIAFGESGAAWGCADVAAPAILDILVEAFPPGHGGEDGEQGRWDNGPRSDWSGPTDDDELLAMAMRATSVLGVLGHKATFAQLWRNAPEIAGMYAGDSEKDGALAMHLAFWTGCDAVRIERLMRRSALVRPKWDEHRTYLKELTIETACDRQGAVYKAPAMRQLYAPSGTTILPPTNAGTLSTGAAFDATNNVVELISPDQVAGLDKALDLISSAAHEVDMHNRVIPAVRALGLPAALMPRVIKGVNKMLKVWDADIPAAQLRSLMGASGGVVKPATQVDDLRPCWVEDYVYLTNPDKFLEKPSGQVMSGMALHRKLARQPAVPMTNAGTKMDVSKLLTEQWDVMTVHDVAYHAAMPAQYEFEGANWVNLYNPATRPLPSPHIAPDAMPGIHAFVAHVHRICRGEPGAAEILLQWLAWQVQRTGQKIRWMPLLVGVEGSGKSLFEAVTMAALGSANVQSVTNNTICNSGGFTDWAEGKAVMFLEELHMAGVQKYTIWNTVKPYVTNDRVPINRKGRRGVQILNGTNHFAFSNFSDALPLSETGRRVMVVETPFSTIQDMWADAGVGSDAEYFDVIFDSLRQHQGSWVRWLGSIHIPDAFDTRRAPVTHATLRMAGAGRDEAEEVARGLVEEGGKGYTSWAVSSSHFTSALVANGHVGQTNTLHYLLNRMGFVKIGRCRNELAKLTSIYVKPEHVKKSPTEVFKAIT